MKNPPDVSSEASPLPHGLSLQRRRWILGALMVGTFLSAIEVTVVGTAMPTIVARLGGLAYYSWVLSVYMFAATVTIPLHGRLADLYGRRPVLLMGMGLFMSGSALCGMAWSIESLIFFRAIQGLGAGAIAPVTLTITGDLYSPLERPKIQSLFSIVWAISAAVGPFVGALLLEWISWRAAFYASLPFGLFSMLIIWRLYHDPPKTGPAPKLDWVSAGLLMLGTSFCLLGLSAIDPSGREAGGLSAPAFTIALGVVGVFLIGALIRRSQKISSPLLPPSIFQYPSIKLGIALSVLGGAILYVVMLFVPMSVQGIQQSTPLRAGLILISVSLGWTGSSLIVGRVLRRIGGRRLIRSSGFWLIFGAFLLFGISPETSTLQLVLGMVSIGLGLGTVSLPLLVAVQDELSHSERGLGTSTLPFFRTMGGVVGVSVGGAILNAGLFSVPLLPDAANAGFKSILEAIRALLDPLTREGLPASLRAQLAEQLELAMNRPLQALLFLSLIYLVVAWWGTRNHPKKGDLGE